MASLFSLTAAAGHLVAAEFPGFRMTTREENGHLIVRGELPAYAKPCETELPWAMVIDKSPSEIRDGLYGVGIQLAVAILRDAGRLN